MRAQQEEPGAGWNDWAGPVWDAGVHSPLPASRTVEHGAAGGCTGAWMLG